DADESVLLDLELHGYTLVSYRASRLPRAVLGEAEVIVATRESDPEEVRALFDLCRSCTGARNEAHWQALLGGLAISEAVVLPVTEEARGDVSRLRLTPRLTPHVRHLSKYIDVPV